ncbi:hypothetical protein MC50_021135 [Raoultella planticola]|nr:hypothetical protein MC50_021135 [Raoultella planticola]PNK80989.1 hypothetical protein CEP62_024350 [Raoultella planticola]
MVIYPSYFKLHLRWLHSIIPVTYLGCSHLPLSCNSNYSGYREYLLTEWIILLDIRATMRLLLTIN